MNKVHINLTIDRDVYMWLVSQDWKKSRSEVVNDFFKQMMVNNQDEGLNKDLTDIQEELNIVSYNTSNLISRKAILEEQLAKLKYYETSKNKKASENNFFLIKSDEEKTFWLETLSIIERSPELKEGRYRYYNNVFSICSFDKWLEKLDKLKGELLNES